MTEQTIGNNVTVAFHQFGNNESKAKVDTGATTSSLHAVNIKVSGDRVSFVCPVLSTNVVTLPLATIQKVHSADAGGVDRPVVMLDVSVDGQNLPKTEFNLNDRSNMDSPILIGQNILQAGQFLIDPNEDAVAESVDEPIVVEPIVGQLPVEDNDARALAIADAINILLDHQVTLQEIVNHINTNKE